MTLGPLQNLSDYGPMTVRQMLTEGSRRGDNRLGKRALYLMINKHNLNYWGLVEAAEEWGIDWEYCEECLGEMG